MKVNRKRNFLHNARRVKRFDEELLMKSNRANSLDNQETLATRNGIALVLNQQGKYQEALDILEDGYHKQKEMLGSEHNDTLATKNGIAVALDNQGRYETRH